MAQNLFFLRLAFDVIQKWNDEIYYKNGCDALKFKILCNLLVFTLENWTQKFKSFYLPFLDVWAY